MKPESAKNALRIIRTLSCASVHIGGGEPMLNPRALIAAVRAEARKAGVGIDYVGTGAGPFAELAPRGYYEDKGRS